MVSDSQMIFANKLHVNRNNIKKINVSLLFYRLPEHFQAEVISKFKLKQFQLSGEIFLKIQWFSHGIQKCREFVNEISHPFKVTELKFIAFRPSIDRIQRLWEYLKKKVLFKIFNLIFVGNGFRVQTYKELCVQQLYWLGYVVQLEEDVLAKPVFKVEIDGRRRKGPLCL